VGARHGSREAYREGRGCWAAHSAQRLGAWCRCCGAASGASRTPAPTSREPRRRRTCPVGPGAGGALRRSSCRSVARIRLACVSVGSTPMSFSRP